MPTSDRHPRHRPSLADRVRSLLSPPAPASRPDPFTGKEITAADVVAWATRELLHAESTEEVAGIVARTVDRLGGRVVPAGADDPDALPLDVSFGVSEPMLPTAPAGSTARADLERHLPGLVSDARRAADVVLQTAHLSADVASDPHTGLETRASFVRELHRLRRDDAVVVVRLTVPEPDPGEEDELDDAVVDFAAHLRARLQPGDHAARIEEDEFGVLLRGTGTAGTTVAVARLRSGWEQEHPDIALTVGVAPFRDSGTASLQAAYARLDDQLTSDAPDADAGGAPPPERSTP